MKDQSITPKKVPLDILQVYSFLQDFRADLSDVMMLAVDEWSAALRDDIRSWLDSAGPEPGWQSFRDWLNEICWEDAMPLLFPKQPPEAVPAGKNEDLAKAGFVAGKGEAYDYLPEWMQLPPLYHNENNPNPLALIKLFTPWSYWSWFLMESSGDDLLFGLVVGMEVEFGYVSLRELQSVTGPMGLRIERDLWFPPTPVRDLPEYKERWGNNGPYPGGSCPGSPEWSAPESSAVPPPFQELPDGWTAEDIRFLLAKLTEGPILIAEGHIGIPTIHADFGAETRHLGFGLMQVAGDGYTLHFDAGGAMQHSPTGKSWTKLTIEGTYPGYDHSAVRQTLENWLRAAPESEEIKPWQMTRLAYQEQRAIRVADGLPVLNGADGDEHAHLVRTALARGELIPREVLVDYPDLLPEGCGYPAKQSECEP